MIGVDWLVLLLALGWPAMFVLGVRVEKERRRNRLTHTR